MKINRFRVAKKEMENADYSGSARIGCAIFYKGTLLAKGHNSDKTSLLQKRYNKYRRIGENYPAKNHAELSALKKIRWLDIDFSLVEVYIYREWKDGTLAMSRPCESCMAFIKQLGIKNVYYTTPDGYAEEKIVRI